MNWFSRAMESLIKRVRVRFGICEHRRVMTMVMCFSDGEMYAEKQCEWCGRVEGRLRGRWEGSVDARFEVRVEEGRER